MTAIAAVVALTATALPSIAGEHYTLIAENQQNQIGESESITLNYTNMPIHTHQVRASNQFSGGDHPSGNYLGASAVDNGFYDKSANTSMADDMIAPSGGSNPFDIRQPYLGINYIICMAGIYPPRDY